MDTPPNCTVVLPRATVCLHRECLAARSLLFRAILSGESPRVPPHRRPRVLPSPPSHPVLVLPVPDPSSIHHLFHWMYLGKTDHIQHALDRGEIRWEGVARNVEYLGLSTDIKVFLGRWYRTWHLPARDRSPCPDDDPDSDSDSGSDVYSSPLDDEDEDECSRGRTRDVKPLVRLCGQLRVCTT